MNSAHQMIHLYSNATGQGQDLVNFDAGTDTSPHAIL